MAIKRPALDDFLSRVIGELEANEIVSAEDEAELEEFDLDVQRARVSRVNSAGFDAVVIRDEQHEQHVDARTHGVTFEHSPPCDFPTFNCRCAYDVHVDQAQPGSDRTGMQLMVATGSGRFAILSITSFINGMESLTISANELAKIMRRFADMDQHI